MGDEWKIIPNPKYCKANYTKSGILSFLRHNILWYMENLYKLLFFMLKLKLTPSRGLILNQIF